MSVEAAAIVKPSNSVITVRQPNSNHGMVSAATNNFTSSSNVEKHSKLFRIGFIWSQFFHIFSEDVSLSLEVRPIYYSRQHLSNIPVTYKVRARGCWVHAESRVNLEKITLWLWLTVCHGKSPCLIGKPSISIRAIHFPWLGQVSHNQMVSPIEWP